MSYREVMDMPLRAFWSFSGSMHRIQAEKNMNLLHMLAASQSGEQYTEAMESLKAELGTPTVQIDNRRDENATQTLRDLMSGF